MSKFLDFIKDNNLTWQPSFNGSIGGELSGYRGILVVEEGKEISSTRKLPPKIQAKQAIVVCDDKIKFFACELESFEHFKPMFEKYKEFFSADSLNILYVINLDGEGTFEYEGVKFTAYVLDESSVWNELLELADLEKGDMKKLSAEEKIEKLYEELLDSDTDETAKTYDEMYAMMGTSTKQLMGAV
jgi:hypothetical protein